MDDKIRDKNVSHECKNMAKFDALDEYIDTVGNLHAPQQLRDKVVNMAYKKRVVSTRLKGWAVAAATVVVLCLCFHSQIMAFAESISYKITYIIGKNNRKEFSGDMGYVPVNTPKGEDFGRKYSTIEELEELMGVTFLKSDYAYVTSLPHIGLERKYYEGYNPVTYYSIYDDSYYMNNMELEEASESGGIWHSLADDAYKITYEATITNDANAKEEAANITYEYKYGVYVEEYETKSGYDAYIFMFNNEYNAVIFDHNIKYLFRADGLGTIGKPGTIEKLDVFKEFLDTLK